MLIVHADGVYSYDFGTKHLNVYVCTDIRIAETLEMFFCVHLPFVSNSSGMLLVAALTINSHTCRNVCLSHPVKQCVFCSRKRRIVA